MYLLFTKHNVAIMLLISIKKLMKGKQKELLDKSVNLESDLITFKPLRNDLIKGKTLHNYWREKVTIKRGEVAKNITNLF